MKEANIVALFLCGCISLFADSINLLKNGEFKQVQQNGVPVNWGFSFPKENKEHVSVKTSAGETFCRISEKIHDAIVCRFSQVVPGIPQTKYSFEVDGLIKVDDPGTEYSCTVIAFFQDEKGKWLSNQVLEKLAYHSDQWKNATITPSGKWVSIRKDFVTPPGTSKLGIRLDLAGKGIEAKWRNAKLEMPQLFVKDMLNQYDVPSDMPKDGIPVSSNKISLTPDWSNKDAQMKRSAVRFELCLNGLWGYRPADAQGAWAYQKVPGIIRSRESETKLYGNTEHYRHDLAVPICIARTVELPAMPQGIRCYLKLDGSIMTTYRVIWNQKTIGFFDNDFGGEIEIPSDLLKQGKNDLVMIALTRAHGGHLSYLYAAGQPRPYTPAPVWNPSMIFDVYLTGKGQTPIFDSVRITPSWSKKQLQVTFPSNEIAKDLKYSFVVSDIKGKVLLKKTGLTAVQKENVLELSADWQNPVVWTPDTPNLLTIQLKAEDASGKLMDESLPVTFGFREITRIGKTMYLNGQELRLRPRMSMGRLLDDRSIRRGFSFYKDMGFNAALRNSSMQGLEDTYLGMSCVRAADELGLFYVAYTPLSAISSGQFFSDNVTEMSPELMKYINDRLIARYYNHPSVIAYSGFGTSPGDGAGISYANQPQNWGIAPIDSDKAIQDLLVKKGLTEKVLTDRLKASVEFMKEFKKMDPSRLFLTHYDVGGGDGWGSFDYFNWTPIQEREEWFTNYPKYGVKPVGSWEHGNPYPMSFVNHAIPDGDEEPWVTEYAAIWLGPEAYKLEQDKYLSEVKRVYNPKLGKFGGRGHWANGLVSEQPVYPLICQMMNTRQFRSWRMAGVNMGIEPFGPPTNYIQSGATARDNRKRITRTDENLKTPGMKSDHYLFLSTWPPEAMLYLPETPSGKKPDNLNSFGEALYQNNNTFLGFLAGDKDNPFAKTHIFVPGETIRKQIALIYDGFIPLSGTVSGTVKIDGVQIQSIKYDFQFNSSGTQYIPLNVVIPSGIRGTAEKPASGIFELEFKTSAGKNPGIDKFAFSVFTPQKLEHRGIVLYDPVGTSENISFFAETTVKTPDFKNAKCVIIATGALSADTLKCIPKKLPVLILEQPDGILEQMGFRTYPIRLREFWSDAALNMDSELLRDWRGGRAFHLGESTKPLRQGYNNISSTTGMIAGTVIDTPTSGNFTPLIHGGFDMAQTAVLAGYLGNHPVIFCQAALNGNIQIEPAAKELFHKLIEYLKNMKEPSFTPAVIGKPELLAKLGAKEIKSGFPKNGAVLITESVQASDVKSFVENGGTAIILPQNDDFYKQLDIPFNRKNTHLFSVDGIPGLNAGNGHFRQNLNTVLFGNSAIFEKKTGKGKVILIGFDPQTIDTGNGPYLRFTYLRQMRTLAQLLTNAGMQLKGPSESMLNQLTSPPVKMKLKFERTVKRATVLNDSEWLKQAYDDSKWTELDMKKGTTELIDAQLRLDFCVSESENRLKDLILDAGTFDDFDQIWLNGVKIGETSPVNTPEDKAWSVRRIYPVPAGLLKKGKNILMVRTWNRNGLTKNWKAIVRGPFEIRDRIPQHEPYALPMRHCDDPYLLHQW